MTITLRPHQVTAIQDEKRLRAEWEARNLGHPINTLIVLPTGAGKSLTLAEYAKECYLQKKICIVFAHRDVLIEQLSSALCKMGIRHSFITSNKARTKITNLNLENFGDSFYDETSSVIVSSNPTFASRLKRGLIPQSLLERVYMWIQDEAHHTLKQSQTWGSCVAAMPNARGIGFTATPKRSDKKGLGRDNDGVFDVMSVTTSMWDLIQKGMLSPYKVYIPPSKVDRSVLRATASGDYNQKEAANEVDRKEIIGDAVAHYLKVSPGKPAITFCQNIDHAHHVAKQFNEAGVPSKVVSSKTEPAERAKAMKDFEYGHILNLVNVDLLGEGYDCPAVTTVIMLRITMSYSLFKQQFGRLLRNAEGKVCGYLLDHVGNVRYFMHELNLEYIHDDPVWTLDRETKRAKNSDNTVLAKWVECSNVECGLQYLEKDHDKCPDCGHVETEEEQVKRVVDFQNADGELEELDIDIVNALIAKRSQVDKTMEQFGKQFGAGSSVAKHVAMNNHAKRSHMQSVLRTSIQKWCENKWRETGWSKDLIHREFQRVFGTTVLQAQVMSEREATQLTERIQRV